MQPNDESDESKSDDSTKEGPSHSSGGVSSASAYADRGVDMDESYGAGGASGDDWEDIEPSTPSHRPDRGM